MKKLILAIAATSLLAACEKEETPKPEPLKQNFEIATMTYNVLGSDYDLTSPPDVYFVVFENGIKIGTSGYYADAYSGTINLLPGDFTMKLNSSYQIELWDFDDPDDDDKITTLTFKPVTNQTSWSASTNQAQLTVKGTWK